MIQQLIPLVASILGGIIQVLRQNNTHPAITDSLDVLETVLKASSDVEESLAKLRDEVAALAAAGEGPSGERLDALQASATTAIERIRAAAAAKAASAE